MEPLTPKAQFIRMWHDKLYKEWQNTQGENEPWSYYLARAIDKRYSGIALGQHITDLEDTLIICRDELLAGKAITIRTANRIKRVLGEREWQE